MSQDVLALVRDLDNLTAVKLLRHVGPMLFEDAQIEHLVDTFQPSTKSLADLTNLTLSQKRETLSTERAIWLARALLAALASQPRFVEVLVEALNSLRRDKLGAETSVPRGLVTDVVRLLASAEEAENMEVRDSAGEEPETGEYAHDSLVDLAEVALAPEDTPLPIPDEGPTTAILDGSTQVTTSPGLPNKPAFYFQLEGEAASGSQVRCGSNVDLIFNYDMLPDDVLVKVTGKKLEEIRQRSGSLELTIIPHGFSIRDGVWTRTAQFKGGRLKEAVRFCLRSDDEPRKNSGILVLFRVSGALIYEHFLRIQLVAGIPVSSKLGLKPINIDLDNVLEAKKNREQRDYVLNIQALNEQYILQRRKNGKSLPVLTSTIITPTKLATLLQRNNESLNKIINKSVLFSKDYHSFNPGLNPKALHELEKFMQSMATVGWQLYKQLSLDKNGFGIALREINDLPPNSRIAIETDGCFIPWGILYPTQFNKEWPDEVKPNLAPHSFWGYRFLIECLLVGSLDSDSDSHQSQTLQTKLFVSLNINQSIDDKLKDNLSLALQSHKTFFKHTIQSLFGELLNTPEQIKKLLNDKQARASFIYFYCHGQNENPFQKEQIEKIEIAPNETIDPFYISDKQKFPCHPVIFLNSCSAGASSPLSFLGFSKQFKQAGAEGMIVPDFAVPIRFAAAFGQEIMHRYIDGEPIGSALLDLRRTLVDHMNPLGLLYSLQCPLDVRVECAEPESVT